MGGDVSFHREAPEADEVYGFYVEMGWEPGLGKGPGALRQAMLGSWFVCCAREQGRLIGMVRVVSDGHLNAYICGLGVLEAFRGRGNGARLMKEALAACQTAGLVPQLMSEHRLTGHYEGLGFVKFAEGMKWAGEA